MRNKVALALALLFLWSPATAEEIDLHATPAPKAATEESVSDDVPRLDGAPINAASPIPLSCAAAILVEPKSGQVLLEMNADTPRTVASVTKIMTILLTLEAVESGRISTEQQVCVSKNAAGMGGSQVLLDVNEMQSVDVLLKSMIVGSANDASVALAECLYGSEALCVDAMNERARVLGMQNTVFVNCTGLPAEGQHTTARDVAIMSIAMLRHPLYYDYAQIWLDEVDHGDGRVTQLTNTNKLIRIYDGCDGGKTGSTDEAGYCVSATAKRGDMRLIAVVLGADSGSARFDTAAGMLDFGFAGYRLYPVAQKGTRVRGGLAVSGGDVKSLTLALDADLTLLVAKGSEEDIRLEPDLPESISAPVSVGQLIGHVCVLVNEREVARLPVTSLTACAIKGFDISLRRFWHLWPFAG